MEFLVLEIYYFKVLFKTGQIGKLYEKKIIFEMPPFREKVIFLNFVKSNNITIPNTFREKYIFLGNIYICLPTSEKVM